jgi:DNA adenine methylase
LIVLSRYASRVTVTEMDGIDLIAEHLHDAESFIYADPPYLQKGDHLYLDTLDWDDHVRLATLLREGGQWFLTYDADPRITQDLYKDLRCAEFTMSHSAAVQHQGHEYAVFAPCLTIPTLAGLGNGESAAYV